MNKIKCLLVDDEPPAIALLEKYTSMIDQLEVVDTSYSAVKAFDLLKTKKVDLLFLDIRMPVLNGIDFIKTLKRPPAIILTTAYREYALDGYDLDIIDYLLKPIAFKRFLKAVDRYRERLISPVFKQSDSTEQRPKHIFLNVNKTHHKVILTDILYIESLKDYVRIHMTKNNLVVKGNIGSFEEVLPTNQFIRIHRSFIINLAQIQSFNQSEIEINEQKLPIGTSYRNQLMKRLA